MTQSSSSYLILGGTGSFGFAFTQEVIQQGHPVTLLVRSKAKADKLFQSHPLLTIIEGDAADKDLLISIAKGHSHILHALNVPYQNWQEKMMPFTEHVIEAAQSAKASILFPGNVYNFGLNTTGIHEDSPVKPISQKGKLRQQLEEKLESASQAGVKIIILRLPDFWGPNVDHAGWTPVFKGALAGKKMPWLVNNQIPHQLVFNRDGAAILYKLSQEEDLPTFTKLNFGGEVVENIAWFTEQVARVAGTQAKPAVTSKGFLRFVSLFTPIVKELKEMFYLYENNVYLVDDKIKAMYPDFKLTPLDEAIAETLDWFRAQA